MKKQSNTPQIRFHNYKELWECDRLKNIFRTIRNAFVGTATPYYVEKGHFYLESNNVKNGKINYNSQIFINDEFYEKQRDKWLKTNDIVMVQSGHVGHTAVIPKELNNTAAHALIVFTDYKKEVNPHFLNYQFQSSSKRKELDLISTGNTIKHILASEMKSFKMDFPTVEEQTAIGSLFRTLDDLLASYKDNLTNYQTLKATMLSKMLPKAGQTVPEIRLDGFEGEWEEKKLGSLGSVAMNKRIFKDETSDYGDIPFYKIGTFGGTADSFITKEKFKEYKEKYPYPEIGDILISASGSIGRTVVYNGEDAYYQDSNIVWLKHDQKLDNSYLKQYYGIIKWSGIEGTTIKRLYNKNILETNIFLPPSVAEQQAIGTYFSNLDNLIVAHQEKISQLETLKKKLLQDMFI
ncbi:restriction endonuclease subunit S [Streptococcus salivarius]